MNPTPFEFSVRQARPEDAEEACAVLRRSIRECCVEDHGGDETVLASWLGNKTPENLRAWFGGGGYAVVAEVGGVISGVAQLGADGKISLCYLLPEVRFRGVGKAMLTELEAEARRRGATRVELESTRTALEFYQRNGYAAGVTEQSPLGLSCRRMLKELAPR